MSKTLRLKLGLRLGWLVLLLGGFITTTVAALGTDSSAGLALKTVPAEHFYFVKKQLNKDDIADKAKLIGVQMVTALTKKTNAKINGGFTFVYQDLDKADGADITLEMGFPISRKAKRLGAFKSKKTTAFKCSYQSFSGQAVQLKAAWTALYRQTLTAGHQLSGESRAVVLNPGAEGRVSMELQLGIL